MDRPYGFARMSPAAFASSHAACSASACCCGVRLPGQDVLEPLGHDLVEVLRRQDVDVVAERVAVVRGLREVAQDLLEQRRDLEALGLRRLGRDRVEERDLLLLDLSSVVR
jgi:hypothetical protein